MKHFALTLVTLILLCMAFAADFLTFQGKVVNIADGVTITIM